MGYLIVLIAAVAAFALGAVYYSVLSEPWKAASGVPLGEDGKPTNAANPLTYVLALVFTILVAGMIRHVFALSGIDTVGEGAVAGLGIGLFIVTPWMGIHYLFSARPMRLLVIDGGYATLGCTVIGTILGLG